MFWTYPDKCRDAGCCWALRDPSFPSCTHGRDTVCKGVECGPNAVCSPEYYGSCVCLEGYILSEDAQECVPVPAADEAVDKCADVQPCDDPNAGRVCSPESGAGLCVCNDGYVTSFTDDSSCAAIGHQCDGTCADENAACSLDNGCVCNDGYTSTGDYSECTAIDAAVDDDATDDNNAAASACSTLNDIIGNFNGCDLYNGCVANTGFVDNAGYSSNGGYMANDGYDANGGFVSNSGYDDANSGFMANDGAANSGFMANDYMADPAFCEALVACGIFDGPFIGIKPPGVTDFADCVATPVDSPTDNTPACEEVWRGDGVCDEACNTAEYDYDGGDCEPEEDTTISDDS